MVGTGKLWQTKQFSDNQIISLKVNNCENRELHFFMAKESAKNGELGVTAKTRISFSQGFLMILN